MESVNIREKQRESKYWAKTKAEYLIAERYAAAIMWAAFWIGLGLALGIGGADLVEAVFR